MQMGPKAVASTTVVAGMVGGGTTGSRRRRSPTLTPRKDRQETERSVALADAVSVLTWRSGRMRVSGVLERELAEGD